MNESIKNEKRSKALLIFFILTFRAFSPFKDRLLLVDFSSKFSADNHQAIHGQSTHFVFSGVYL